MIYYCPYLGELIQQCDITPDHIIALSLGGCDKLTIPASRDANTRIGTEIEANEFFFANHRIAADARGHSGKPPECVIKNASSSEHSGPLRVALSPGQLQCYDPVKRHIVDQPIDLSFDLTVNLDRFFQVRARLLAKVAIGFGYYEFGERFHRHANHSNLRLLLWADNNSPIWHDQDVSINLALPVIDSGCDHPVSLIIRKIFTSVGRRSCLAIVPTTGRLNIYMGAMGHYAGFLGFDCDVDQLWKEPENRYGLFLLIRDNRVLRMGLREAWERLLFAPHCADVWSPDTPEGLKEFIETVRPRVGSIDS